MVEESRCRSQRQTGEAAAIPGSEPGTERYKTAMEAAVPDAFCRRRPDMGSGPGRRPRLEKQPSAALSAKAGAPIQPPPAPSSAGKNASGTPPSPLLPQEMVVTQEGRGSRQRRSSCRTEVDLKGELSLSTSKGSRARRAECLLTRDVTVRRAARVQATEKGGGAPDGRMKERRCLPEMRAHRDECRPQPRTTSTQERNQGLPHLHRQGPERDRTDRQGI